MIKGLNYFFVTSIIWLSFVLCISFFEAPIKFHAEGIIYEQALRIGKIVFLSLNKIEIMFASTTTLYIIYKSGTKKFLIGLIPIVILIIQTIFILPELIEQMNDRINKIPLETHKYHIGYIITEILKVITLIIFIFIQIKEFTYETRHKK